MRRLFSLATVIAIAFTVIAPADELNPSQAASPDSDAVLIRSDVKLIQVNVVVQDSKGQPVTGLKAEDFTIFERNEKQTISFFSAESRDKEIGPAPTLGVNQFTNRPHDSKQLVPNVTAIVLDGLNTPWVDQSYSRQQVIRALSKLQPHDRIAIYVLGADLRVLHDFTDDRSALEAKLRKYSGYLSHLLDMAPGAVFSQVQPSYGSGRNLAAMYAFRMRSSATSQALIAIADRLLGIPGRKNLVWLTAGNPPFAGYMLSRANVDPIDSEMADLQRATLRLNQANVAVYPVDARGLMTDPRLNAEFGSDNLLLRPTNYSSFIPVNVEVFDLIAKQTGGRAYYNTNDVDGAVVQAVRDAEVAYTVAYYSTAPQPDDKFRSIKVRVNRPGVSVRHRAGYVAVKESIPSASDVDGAIRKALWTPLDATAIPLDTTIERKPGSTNYEVKVRIDPRALSLNQNGDRWKGKFTLAVFEKSEAGESFVHDRRAVETNMTKETYEKALTTGLSLSTAITHNSKATSVRIVVLDHATLATGALTIPLAKVVDHEGAAVVPGVAVR